MAIFTEPIAELAARAREAAESVIKEPRLVSLHIGLDHSGEMVEISCLFHHEPSSESGERVLDACTVTMSDPPTVTSQGRFKRDYNQRLSETKDNPFPLETLIFEAVRHEAGEVLEILKKEFCAQNISGLVLSMEEHRPVWSTTLFEGGGVRTLKISAIDGSEILDKFDHLFLEEN